MESNQGKPCVFCGDPKSGRKGEHVFPRWFLDALLARGPFEYFSKGSPLTWPNTDKPVTSDKPYEILLPCCPTCNGHLNKRFETPVNTLGQNAVWLDRPLTLKETEIVAEWWLKTLLLLVHPDVAKHEVFGIALGTSLITWSAPDPSLYAWMVTASDPPPNSLSVFAHRPVAARKLPTFACPLPQVHADGDVHESRSAVVSILGLGLTLIHHPGWALQPKPIRQGLMAKIWPNPLKSQRENMPGLPSWPLVFERLEVHYAADTFDPKAAVDLSSGSDLSEAGRFPNISYVGLMD